MKFSIKYIIALGICLILSMLIMLSFDLFEQTETTKIFKVLSDSFAIPGIFFLGVGALTFCSAKGAFDGLGFILRSLFVTHNWSKRKFGERQTYSEYIEEKRAKEKPVPKHILLAGVTVIFISIIFTVLFFLFS